MKIVADHLKTVGGDQTLQYLLLCDPDIIFSEQFPPEGINCSISFPPLSPPRTFPEDRASVNPIYQSTTGNQPHTSSFRHLRASPLSFSRPQTSSDHLDVFCAEFVSSFASNNKAATQAWISWGIINWLGRNTTGEEDISALSASNLLHDMDNGQELRSTRPHTSIETTPLLRS